MRGMNLAAFPARPQRPERGRGCRERQEGKLKNRRFTPIIIPLFLAAVVLAAPGCRFGWNLRQDPLFDAFLEKTSLLMTEEEIEIYMRLPDVSSKEEFVAEFWKMRDFDPTTEQSEGEIEFKRRVDFANHWFDPQGSCRGHAPTHSTRKALGWETDRGRIYLVMGPPDQVAFEGQSAYEAISEEHGDLLCRATGWYYSRLRYSIHFSVGHTSLLYDEKTVLPGHEDFKNPGFSSISTHAEAMKRAKLDWMSWEYRGWTAKPFLFKAWGRKDGLAIRIPIDRLSFESVDKRLRGRLETEVHVYQAAAKKEVLRDVRTLDYAEEDVLGLKAVEYVIPFHPKDRGAHLFDIIVTFEGGTAKAKYRNYAKKRY